MARLRNDSRRHRLRRSVRRLFPLWLIVCLVGLGLALAAYQQQRQSAVEIAEAPRDAAEDRATEADADPAPPPEDPSAASPEGAGADVAAKDTSQAPLVATTEQPAADREADESAGADTDVATASETSPEEPPASGPDIGSTEMSPGTGTEPGPAVEAERLATLDRQEQGRPGASSDLRTGTSAARPESEQLSLPREPAESSSVAELPASPSERKQAAVTAAPLDRPGSDADAPAAGARPLSPEPLETRDSEAAPPSQTAPAPAPATPPEQQITTASPTREAGAPRQDEPDDTPSAKPEVETESLVAGTIRRALEALLGGRPDELVQPLEPPEQKLAQPEQPEPRDKLAGQSPTAPRLAAVEPKEEAKPDLTAPTFDVVRVQRGGQAVIAGRSAPGAEVELRAGGELIDRVRADPLGQWVSVPQRPLPAGDQELTVAARSGDALSIESEQVVVLAVPAAEPTSGRPDHPAAAAVALEAPGEEALAVLLPKDGRGQGRVLQAPGRIGSDGQLALLMLDYDETGQIQLSGEAAPGATVRVYVDNELSGEALVGEDGAWSITLDRTLAPGNYTLRVDQLDRSGQTVARLETPFTRVAQPPVQGDALVDYVIVQPGNSLWRIARRLFGSGFEYVHIYEANHTQIRDPDLIYPGQVFEIPAAIGGAG